MLTIKEIFENINRYEKKTSKIHKKNETEILGFSPLLASAIGEYMNDSQINFLLRDGVENEKVRSFITLFDMAFEQVTPIEQNLIVFRGIKPPEGDFPGFYSTDKGFISTSVYLDTTGPFRGESCCLQIILIPKGSKVLFLPSSLSTLFKDEGEILLNRNSSFELVDEGNLQIENEDGELNTVKTVLLNYIPGDFVKPSKLEYCKILLKSKLKEWEYSNLDDWQKTKEDFKKFVTYFPDTCQMITRQNFKELLHLLLHHIQEKIFNILVEGLKYTINKWYDFYYILLESYPCLIKGDKHILLSEDKINMEIFHFLYKNYRSYQICWQLANLILEYGKNLSPFNTLIRLKIPGFQLHINNKINVLDLQTLYTLHPIAKDFNNVWYAIYHSNDDALLNFALTYQIPINEFMLTNNLLLRNLKLTVQLAKLPFTKSNMRSALINLWSHILSHNHIYTVQQLIDNGVPFVANDYLNALLESHVSSEIKSIIIPYINS